MIARISAMAMIAMIVCGCATIITTGAQTVATSLHIVTDVEDAAAAADKTMKDSLLAASAAGSITTTAADAQNDAWEHQLGIFTKALHTFKDSLVFASHVIDLASHGVKVDIGAAINDAVQAYASLLQAIKDSGLNLNLKLPEKI